ncbi:MAG TPA: AAA family ATPase [Actinoplanes sp.]|jgi:DNA-binding CsgD family transcriptional regulator
MKPAAPTPRRPLGRLAECDRLDEVVAQVEAGGSATLVLRGEPGIGKTVLIDYLAERVSGTGRVLRANGVESEMDLPFAGLHQLCMPILHQVARLPQPQRDAIESAFGMQGHGTPDRLMVALAALNLVSTAAETEPLFCFVDDAHWLDQASAQALLFVARRLLAEQIGLVVAVRAGYGVFAGLPELEVNALREPDARRLLASVVDGRLDARVSQRILAETHGNPLAIIQLPRGLSAAELSAGLGPSTGLPLSGRIEHSFLRRYEQLSAPVQRLLLLAAAEPLGDPALLRRAATASGLPDRVVTAADTGGLMSMGLQIQFEHPLARSAIYGAAIAHDRHAAHRAIAQAIDPAVDPDHYAWHRSQATASADAEIAQELEDSAGRALARGGLAAAAAILERAAVLSTTREETIRRGLAAARATYEAGAPDRALGLVATLESASLGPMERAAITRLRGQISLSLGRPDHATGLLLNAAVALTALDPATARATYFETLEAATYAGRFGSDGGLAQLASEVIRVLPATPHEPGVVDYFLDAMLIWAIDGLPRAVPTMRRALAELSSATTDPVAAARWAWLAIHVVNSTWADDHWLAINERYRTSVREAGALSLLPSVFAGSALLALWTGDFAAADTLLDDAGSISTAVGLGPVATRSRAMVAAWRGDRATTEAILMRVDQDGRVGGEQEQLSSADYCAAILGNGLGDYAAAYAAARASAYEQRLGTPELLLPELIEAAVRLGERAEAERALQRLAVRTTAAGTSWALGVEAYCRGLLAQGDAAEAFYRQAIRQLDACRIVPFRHRARLAYGEWLRRERRRVEAREQLQTAYDAFTAMGAHGFAERARRELLATGGSVSQRTEQTPDDLTPQELQVARLAAANASNQEIAAQLFISPSTVGYHLSKAFRKLDINSRRQLTDALSSIRVPQPGGAAG